MSLVPYCGIKKVPKGRKRGTVKECKEAKQIRYYGLTNADVEILFTPKPKKKPIKRVKHPKDTQKPTKQKQPIKPTVKPSSDINVHKLKKNKNVITSFGYTWYKHPSYDLYVNDYGDIMQNYKNLATRWSPEGTMVSINDGIKKRKSYPVKKILYEAYYDIKDLNSDDIIHLNGDIYDDDIKNLGLAQ